jgi:serine/threonine protein kinase
MSDDRPLPHDARLGEPPPESVTRPSAPPGRLSEDSVSLGGLPEPGPLEEQSSGEATPAELALAEGAPGAGEGSAEAVPERALSRPELPTGADGGAEGTAATGAALRERSLSPPGPLSDRYLGCTIDNRCKVEGIVGEGGMGVVYQCRHKIIDKRVALKILRADLARDPEVTERFLMEAKAASAIPDEHIISISDFGQLPDGAAYFVMEFLDGTPLAQIAGGGKQMPLERILPIARQLSEGLGSAHQRGIVHRDLKPDNVFLIQRGKEPDFVKILDFGIAKVTSTGTGRLTQVGSVFGTPHYMSPEQAAATPLDQRGDIYSLGVMLYELATGRVPFDAENFVGILSQHLYQEPIPPRQAAPDANIPPEFEALILKCMAKKPEHRYQSMLQLRDDLWQLERRLRRHQTPSTAPVPIVDATASVDGTALSTELTLASLRPRRWPLYTAMAAPVLIVLGVLGVRYGSLDRERAAAQAHASSSANVSPAPLAPSSGVSPSSGAVPGASTLASPAPSPPAPEPVKEAPAPAHVLIGVAPTTAHVFLEGRDLGASPVSVDVPPNTVLAVEVRQADYETQSLTLDGSQSRFAVELQPRNKKHGAKVHSKNRRADADPAADSAGTARTSSGARATKGNGRNKAAPVAPPPKPRNPDESIGGQLFVEPWQKQP